jgi:hypothetical protein
MQAFPTCSPRQKLIILLKDFKKGQTLIQFINRYTDVVINDKAKISFAKYDWKLNDSK